MFSNEIQFSGKKHKVKHKKNGTKKQYTCSIVEHFLVNTLSRYFIQANNEIAPVCHKLTKLTKVTCMTKSLKKPWLQTAKNPPKYISLWSKKLWGQKLGKN